MKNTNSNNPLWRRTSRWRNILGALGVGALLMNPSANAQDIQVGTGTATQSNLPIVSCYGYTYSQQIYTQAQVNTAGTIDKIRFYFSSGASTNSTGWRILMGHTALTTFATTTSWVASASLTEVFNGVVTYPAAGNWMEITLTTPFAYNNTDNLVIAVDENTAGYYCSNNFRSFTSGANTGIYYRSDATNPDPATPPTASGRTASLAQAQLHFVEPPCVGTPAPGNTTGPATAGSGESFSLGLQNTTAGSGVTYQWYVSTTSAVAGFNPVGAGNSTFPTSQTAQSWYYCDVTCAPNTTSSTVLQVDMGYCASTSTAQTSWFSNFATTGGLTNITNASGASAGGYGDFTAQSVSQSANSSVNFTTTLNGTTVGVRIWVDWNNNFDFLDAGEQMYASAGYVSSASGSFTVPAATPAGNYRMRIKMDYNNSTPTPCGNSARGETEDYTFTVAAPPACPAPTALSAVSATTTGADLGWTENGTATAWDLEIGVTGFTPTGTPTVNDAGTNPYTWTGGAAATTYQFYVRADCGMDNTDVSAWNGPFSFTTLCTALAVPYSEGFEATTGTALPTCWSKEDVNGGTTWNSAAYTGFGSTRAAKYGYSSTLPGDDWLYSPGLTLTGGTSYTVEYSMIDASASFPEAMDVFWGASAANASMTNLIADHTPVPTTATTVSYTFTPVTSGTYYIGWHSKSGADEFDFYIDDVSVIETPGCPIPSGISVSGTSSNGTNVNFTCSGCTGDIIVEYGETGFTPGTDGTAGVGGTLITSAVSPQAIAGLMPTTGYDVYVRQDCSGASAGYSDNAAVTSFTTLALPPANDLPCNAIALTVSSTCSYTTYNNAAATNSGVSPAPTCGFINGSGDVWFTVTVPANGNVTIDSDDLSFTDSGMNVYTADACNGTFVNVECDDDDSPNGAMSLIALTGRTPGETLYVRFWEYGGGASGDFGICAYSPCSPAAATVTAVPNCPSGFDLTVNITSLGSSAAVTINYSVNGMAQTPVGPISATGPNTLTGFAPGDDVDIVIAHETETSCDLTLNNNTYVCPPVNDDCANAIAVACNTITNASTVGSTSTGAPTGCADGLTSAGGIWYTLAGFDGPMTVDLSGSGFDTKLGIFTGACGGLTCVDSDDDGGTGTTSLVSWTGSSAETYYVYVTGYLTNTGAVTMTTICGNNNNACTDNGLAIEFQTDASPFENTWDLLDGTGTFVVASGGPLAAPGALLQEFACVPDGCYQFRVNDSGGNGMGTGGYVVRTQGTNIRIIDNANNFNSGSVSQSGEPFCLPLGTTELLYSSCDKYFWAAGEYVVCNEDAAVAADYNGGGAAGADSGYDFWFFDPNGSYSYVRSRRHNVSDNYANVGSTRTCHMKINNWAAVNHIPNGLKLNVRVRSVVNGVAGAYGPACRFTRDEATAACPPTLLFDVPGFPQFYSCGVNRDFVANTQNRLYARPVAGATQYRFTFDNAELVSPIVRTSNNYYLTLGWAAIVAPPLVPGQSYDVTVEAFKGGNWCVPGNVCIVTINNAVAGGQQNVALDGGPALNMWPNPNNGDVLNMSLLVSDPFINVVSMDIFDLSGKRMIARTVAIQDGLVNTTIDLNGDLADGMYMVKVTAGEEVFTQRVVIQK